MSVVDPADERVEEVDAEGRVLRVVRRADMRRLGLRHRTVFVAVLDDAGARLLVHQRAPWKDAWPLRWDLAFGGVCAVGEGWEDAARRELAEEAGLTIPLVEVGAGCYQAAGVQEVARVFLSRCDEEPTCPDGEVVATEWVALDQLDRWLATHDVCEDSLALVRPHLCDRSGGRRPPAPPR